MWVKQRTIHDSRSLASSATDFLHPSAPGATVTLAYTARLAVDRTVFDERTTESPLVVETDAGEGMWLFCPWCGGV